MSDSARKDLVEAITALVRERRLCAKLLSKPYERGTYEATMARFVELQTTIEALAILQTTFLSQVNGHVGAIAFSRTGDPDVGKFEDAIVLRTFGELTVDPTMLW